MGEIILDHLPQQDDFYRCDDDVAAFVAGLGLGKTLTASDWALTGLALYPRARHFGFSNTYDQLRAGTLRTFFERLETTWIPADRRFEYVDRVRDLHEIRFPRLGATLEVRSVDKPINWKSLEICRAWIDEAQAYPKVAYDMIIGRLRGTATQRRLYPHMPLQARITANPPHTKEHWLYELCTQPDPKTGRPPIRLFTGSTYDNPFLTQDYIDRMESMYDPEVAEAELRGNWIELGKGRVFRRFNRAKHLLSVDEAARRGLPPLEYDPSLPLCWSHDFNLDPLCSVLFQWRRVQVAGYQLDVMYVLDFMRIRNALIENAVEELERRPKALAIARRNGLILYGDVSGNQRSRQTGVSDWIALKQRLTAIGLRGEVRLPGANPSHRQRALSANRLLEDANGRLGVVIREVPLEAPDRTNYIATDLEKMHWKPGTFDIEVPKPKPGEIVPPAKQLTHLGDAVSYPMDYEYPYVEAAVPAPATAR